MKTSNYSLSRLCSTWLLLLTLPLSTALAQTDFYLGSNNPALYSQDEGTLTVSSLYMFPPANFNLQGGRVVASTVIIGQGDTGFRQESYEPLFTHSGGQVLVEGDLALGHQYHGSGVYHLSGGLLACQALHLGANRDAAGTFLQSGGTDQAERLLISEEAEDPMTLPDCYNHSGYFMSDGSLFTSETIVGAGREGIFKQAGGLHQVAGTLAVQGGSMRSSYYLGAGQLVVQDFWLGGNFSQEGGFFMCVGAVTLAGGNLSLTGGESDLGSLILSNTSSLFFGTNTSIQRWHDSHQWGWASGAKLLVRSWSGSLRGGGMHQLYFGMHARGLRPSQVAQITFLNPEGLPAGNYEARLLPTGEVVPQMAPGLMTGRSPQLYLPMRVYRQLPR